MLPASPLQLPCPSSCIGSSFLMMRSEVIFGLVSDIAGNENHGANSRAPRRTTGKPGEQRGRIVGTITPPKSLPAAGAEAGAASSFSASSSSSAGCSVRTMNGRPMKIRAIVIPSCEYAS